MTSQSGQLEQLEKRIGAPLLHRSTRALTLTDMGRRYFERVRPIVRDAEMAQVEAMTQHAAPSGLVRVSAPVAYGQLVVTPWLYRFLDRYPAVRLDLRLSDERVNLVAGGYDLAIRMGQLGDSELIARKLADMPLIIVAAPSYLNKHGVPERTLDLSGHQSIVTQTNIDHWEIDGEIVRVKWRISTGNMMATRDALRAGLGLALVPEYLVAADVKSGVLVRVLPNSALPRSEATILYDRSRAPSVTLKALMDDLLTQAVALRSSGG